MKWVFLVEVVKNHLSNNNCSMCHLKILFTNESRLSFQRFKQEQLIFGKCVKNYNTQYKFYFIQQ